ncbi:MAG: type II toxin-antitoxin system Phd/YefM family antitoxin [Trinickia sp.]|uniref:type II toxin-antitoxin system Phd/YefM family antitoxin n=1 Tax=Trinickia sp. TaxID=2571163 RepID=UPI003F7E47A6
MDSEPNSVYIRFYLGGMGMRLSERVKPISYLKAEAAQIVKDLEDTGEPLVITQNGEAKLVVQDVRSYEQTQQMIAMLKLLALAEKDVASGNCREASDVFDELDELDERERGS